MKMMTSWNAKRMTPNPGDWHRSAHVARVQRAVSAPL